MKATTTLVALLPASTNGYVPGWYKLKLNVNGVEVESKNAHSVADIKTAFFVDDDEIKMLEQY